MSTTDSTSATPAPSPVVTAAQDAGTVVTVVEDIGKMSGDIGSAAAAIGTAGIWSAICGFFTALPGIIALLTSMVNWIKAVGGDNPQAYIANLGKAFDQLAAAQTAAQQQAADQALASQIGKIPS